MQNKTRWDTNYPHNLLSALRCPAEPELSADRLAGVHYALSTLPAQSQEFIRLYYREGVPPEEAAAALSLSPEGLQNLKKATLAKLRYQTRWNYLCYGVAGNLKRETAHQYEKGYHMGYLAGLRDGAAKPENTPSQTNVLDMPIETMPLSSHARIVLTHMGCKYIRDLLSFDQYDIIKVRGMGRKTADEIAQVLQSYGVEHTDWYFFLL
ncbi:MAG: hypothetical protein IKJ84_01280 [Oscillospiraceae bacterium]|nr:hypothetical protein [Oscillospiraceae bacterium]